MLCVLYLGLFANKAGYFTCTPAHERHCRARIPYKQCAFPLCRCWRPTVPAPALVPVLRQCYFDSVSCLVEWVWPSSLWRPANKPSSRVVQHIRDDRQQQGFFSYLHHPVPQQNRSSRGKDSNCRHRRLFSALQWWSACSLRCPALSRKPVRRATCRAIAAIVPSLHNCSWHRKY